MLWNYQAPRLYDFNAARFGGITKLPNNHYFFSDTTKSNRVVEIDSQGKELWDLTLDQFQIAIKSVKPFYNVNFLKARGIEFKE